MDEVPRRTSLAPLAFPCFVLCLIGVETEGLLDYQGLGGDHFQYAVEPSPGHIRCRVFQERKSSPKSKFWGRISGGRPRGYPRWMSDGKNFGHALEILKKNKHFGADIHDPKARTSMTPGGFKKLRSEKLRAEFSFPSVGSV